MRALFTTLAIAVPLMLSSQTFEEFAREQQRSFEDYRSTTEQAFAEYRDNVNREYSEMMRQSWVKVELQPAVTKLAIPKPPTPTFAYDKIELTKVHIPISNITEPTQTKPLAPPTPIITIPNEPKPIAPIEKEPTQPTPIKKLAEQPIPIKEELEPPTPIKEEFKQPTPIKEVATEPRSNVATLQFTHYGTPCSIEIGSAKRFKLNGISENDVADAWSQLSTSKYDNIIIECVKYRNQAKLCDWAYLTYVKSLCDKFLGARNQDESTLMQMYILAQSGYKVRIAKGDGALCMMLPFDKKIYDIPYINIDGENYYLIAKRSKGGSYSIFNQQLPNEQRISLHIETEPQFSVKYIKNRKLKSKEYPAAEADIEINQNLVDFYGDYPRSDDMSIYVKTSLSSQIKKSLYPKLRASIAAKSEVDAANTILNFVQTSLEYQTDDIQFGRERPLFADETLYYPYCDCEDRAILFSILVKELIGLDVVLLDYPDHIASAVCFSDGVQGDYFDIKGRQYTVCDPTYIGAKVGCSMDEYKDVEATVVML